LTTNESVLDSRELLLNRRCINLTNDKSVFEAPVRTEKGWSHSECTRPFFSRFNFSSPSHPHVPPQLHNSRRTKTERRKNEDMARKEELRKESECRPCAKLCTRGVDDNVLLKSATVEPVLLFRCLECGGNRSASNVTYFRRALSTVFN
jgi:hypothetical protein